MRDETKMDVYTSGVTGAEYDAGMKQLMSNKEIIIPILQMTVPEFKTCSQEEILQCLDISSITKDDFVSDIPNVDKNLIVYYCAGAVLGDIAESKGLRTASEIFADCAYMDDLSLVNC